MQIQAVLFDLDGTLLPMDEKKFLKCYLENFAAMCERKRLPAKRMTDCLLSGMSKMMTCGEPGSFETNMDRFWNEFFQKAGMSPSSDRSVFDEFYESEFKNVRSCVSPTQAAADCVAAAKRRGLRVILATNPIFPKTATEQRIRWAGLYPDDFELISTYEDYRFTKPDLRYYKEIAEKAGGLELTKCVMVGNDALEDMCAEALCADAFLVTDCLINRTGADISRYKSGSLSDCADFIGRL